MTDASRRARPVAAAPGVCRDRPSAVRTRTRLEAELSTLTGLSLSLLVTDNERTMISTRRDPGGLVVRLHHMFLSADVETLQHLAGYLDKSDARAGDHLGRFIARHRHRIRHPGPRRIHLRPSGEHHDLRAIFERLNGEYFDNEVDARVTWARRTTVRGSETASELKGARRPGRNGGKTRRSIKLGSYRSKDALIRVHPVLDADWVPDFFVAYIVYHEMLHQVVPPSVAGARRAFHGREFRARERRFSAYDEAIAWEQANLRRLLQA